MYPAAKYASHWLLPLISSCTNRSWRAFFRMHIRLLACCVSRALTHGHLENFFTRAPYFSGEPASARSVVWRMVFLSFTRRRPAGYSDVVRPSPRSIDQPGLVLTDFHFHSLSLQLLDAEGSFRDRKTLTVRRRCWSSPIPGRPAALGHEIRAWTRAPGWLHLLRRLAHRFFSRDAPVWSGRCAFRTDPRLVQNPSVAAFAPVAAASGLTGCTAQQRSLTILYLEQYLTIRSLSQVISAILSIYPND